MTDTDIDHLRKDELVAARNLIAALSTDELEVLKKIIPMLSESGCRDNLRRLVYEGATITEMAMRYKINKGVVSALKATGALIIILGGAYATMKGVFTFWQPK